MLKEGIFRPGPRVGPPLPESAGFFPRPSLIPIRPLTLLAVIAGLIMGGAGYSSGSTTLRPGMPAPPSPGEQGLNPENPDAENHDPQKLDPQKLVDAAEDMVKGETAHGTIEMTVNRPDFTRRMRMKSWWQGNEKALIVIEAPKKDAGNKTLKIGNEMWSYLDNTETTIKVPPSMMLQSWNGSDFTNDDLVRESDYAEDYEASIEGTKELDGVPCWRLLLRPKPEAPVVWGKLEYWISKRDTLPVRLEYYSEEGELKRHLVFSDVDKVGSRTIPTTWTMYDDTEENHRTTMKILEMQFDIPIRDSMFSKRELESGR